MLAQKVEIAAAIGLQDLAPVELGIAALGDRRRGGRAARQLLRPDQQIEAALRHREPDAVAVAPLGEPGGPAPRAGRRGRGPTESGRRALARPGASGPPLAASGFTGSTIEP